MKTEYRFEVPDTMPVAITIRGTVRQFKELAKSLDASPFSYPGSILRDQIAAVVNQATSALGESKEGSDQCPPTS